MSFEKGVACNNRTSAVYITGLGHEYPSHSIKQEHFMQLLEKLHPDEVNSPIIQKLGRFNDRSRILSRPTTIDFNRCTREDAMPPEIDWTSRIFRTSGVRLATSACKKAMQEAQLGPRDITHTVAVTCTDQNNPGYDHFVCQELGLRSSVQRSLLHGVGCAGGLSALRTAADIAAAASLRGRPARILVMACELCSLFLQAELQATLQDGELHIGPALFSDGAAALVVCNYLALEEKQTPVFELLEWGSMVVPDTSGHMSYVIKKNGMIATISKFVPEAAIKSIIPMFRHLRAAIDITHKAASLVRSQASSFDWAIHPGGASILQGAKQALCLTDDHIRASLDVYQHHGNSSSPTVLIVLDKLRMMGEGRENVVATSFGPGLIIEMCIMRRCRHIAVPRPFKVDKHTSWYASWLSLRACLPKRGSRRQPNVKEVVVKKTRGYVPILW